MVFTAPRGGASSTLAVLLLLRQAKMKLDIPLWIPRERERNPEDDRPRLYLPMPPLPPRLEDDEPEREGTRVVVIDLDEED